MNKKNFEEKRTKGTQTKRDDRCETDTRRVALRSGRSACGVCVSRWLEDEWRRRDGVRTEESDHDRRKGQKKENDKDYQEKKTELIQIRKLHEFRAQI